MDVECETDERLQGADTFDESEEGIHFQKIINTYRCYKPYSLRRLCKTLAYLDSLPESHREKLVKYRHHLEELKKCIDANYEIMLEVIGDVCQMFENIEYKSCAKRDAKHRQAVKPTSVDVEKTYSVMKQIVREWSDEGAMERDSCFIPILDEINERFGNCSNRHDVSILVPGAGLGRLAYNIAVQGYTCQGNEYSLIMLFASNFILNKCKGSYLYTMYPWAHQYHNNFHSSDQTKSIRFPDVDPSAIPSGTDFSMAAGNFLDIYTESNKWNCVATCFFIDTAHNILAYIETIWNILKPGGFWINLGPLLYHFADMPNEDSIEPSYDILREAILAFGFKMVKEQTDVRCYYTQNLRSMLAYEYKSVYFVCLKPS
ncbi:UPF0586 protein C9orf41-like protein [Dinothrombium tinctorium]|uniref:Carnosine N-methyltransferase n=1 Tax=Dinothrombium tinctorium TaxID=1965070 RepID=A0A3S3P6V4_9ACAR|nr:UPF0586 protein C9orf41-like protein [Dinothrombium tinctorium]